MVSGMAQGLLGVAGWTRDKRVWPGDFMDFAPEPMLDAFTPPPTRAAPRAPRPDDNGQTFNDHLDAMNEPARERPAPAPNEAKDEAAEAPVEAKPVGTDETESADETVDPDVALLGGPLPPEAPPMAAPVVVQIAASQTQPQAPSEAQNSEADAAPVTAPEAPAPTAPATEAEAAAEPAAAPADKNAQAEAKPATADEAPQTQAQPQAQNTQQTQGAPQQPQAPATAPIEVHELPPAIREAIAATIAPVSQGAGQPVQRTAKNAAPTGEAKTESSAPDGKPEATNPNAGAKANTPKASNGGGVTIDAAPALPTQTAAPDSSQIAQSNAVTTMASQASTHVQQAAVDTGAQRAAPAGAQVAREIIRRFDGGNTNFELRLDPAELGRVEVRMEVTRDHRVTAVITADNPQALTELARHARELEQQLQSAGLQLSDSGLSFDLRQGGRDGEADEANAGGRGVGEDALTEQQPAPVARPIGYERWRGVRVDMMV